MHVSSIKRPEIEVKAVKRADRVVIHWNDPKPIHVVAQGVVIEEKVAGRGWQIAEEIDFEKLPTLPELVVGRVEGRKSDDDVTCFINNIGLGYQFAAAGSVVYRKAKESGPRPRIADRLVHRGRASRRARFGKSAVNSPVGAAPGAD